MKRGPPSRAADGDVAVEARDDRRVDRGRHGDLRQRQQRRHRVRVDVGAVGVAQRPVARKESKLDGWGLNRCLPLDHFLSTDVPFTQSSSTTQPAALTARQARPGSQTQFERMNVVSSRVSLNERSLGDRAIFFQSSSRAQS